MIIALGIFIIILDQLSKYLYFTVFKCPEITLIPHVINFTAVKNQGAAWGMFSQNQLFLYIGSGLLVALLLFIFIKHYKTMDKLMRISLIMIIAGAIGNMIDRLALNYVRDMIQFAFISFPVFNIADSSICIGSAMLILDCLFFDGKKFFDDDRQKATDTESETETQSKK